MFNNHCRNNGWPFATLCSWLWTTKQEPVFWCTLKQRGHCRNYLQPAKSVSVRKEKSSYLSSLTKACHWHKETSQLTQSQKIWPQLFRGWMVLFIEYFHIPFDRIYPLDTSIHPLNNWALEMSKLFWHVRLRQISSTIYAINCLQYYLGNSVI